MNKGKATAVVFRPFYFGGDKSQLTRYVSPIGEETFDRVADVSNDLKVSESGNGDFELSIPLDVLGIKMKKGGRILGDLGLLRGNGSETTQRIYWSNKKTGLVSDVPSEARLTPSAWGIWTIQVR